jgi:DNA primase
MLPFEIPKKRMKPSAETGIAGFSMLRASAAGRIRPKKSRSLIKPPAKNVVATAGTAMTVYHLKTLKRFTGDVRLCFDQDSAGQKAAERAIDLAAQADVTLQMITIPDGKDPDELVRKDVKLWLNAVNKPQYVIDWLMARYEAQLDITSAVGKRTFSDVVLKLVKRLPDSVEQDHYVNLLAKKIDVSADSLRKKMQGGDTAAPRLKKPKVETVQVVPSRERIIIEQNLLSMALRHPSLRPVLDKLPRDIFVEPAALTMFEFLQAHPDFDGSSSEGLQKIEDYVKMLVLLSEETPQGMDSAELRRNADILASKLVKEYIKHKKAELKPEIDAAEDATELLRRIKELDDLSRIYPTK